MPITELLEQSAPRAELDQRSRETRLRLEQVERLLVVRPLPRQSLLRRVVYCFRSRIYDGAPMEGRSTPATLSGTHPERGAQASGETTSAAGSPPAARLPQWPHCVRGRRVSFIRRRPPPVGFKPW